MTNNSRLNHSVRRKVVLSSGIAALSLAAWVWFGPLSAWRSIERVPFNPTAARETLGDIRSGQPPEVWPASGDTRGPADDTDEAVPFTGDDGTGPAPPIPEQTSGEPQPARAPEPPPAPAPAPSPSPIDAQADIGRTTNLDVFLILGSDEKPTDPDIRADAILLLLVPEDRSSSMLISVPRALYVTSPCTGEPTAINLNFEGCGSVSGLDLMGVAVEDYTGLTIDHLVLFDFDGFETIIDRIGGLEVCLDHDIKTRAQAPIFLEAGCSTLTGSEALRWVRERQMLERIDDEWRLMEGAGDAGRTARQRDMIRQVIRRADRFESPGALLGLVAELSDSFALDDGFALAEAIDLAWELRVLGGRPASDLSVATRGAVSPEGEFVLVPVEPFSTYLQGLPTH